MHKITVVELYKNKDRHRRYFNFFVFFVFCIFIEDKV
jgi:hypothetical protein